MQALTPAHFNPFTGSPIGKLADEFKNGKFEEIKRRTKEGRVSKQNRHILARWLEHLHIFIHAAGVKASARTGTQAQGVGIIVDAETRRAHQD